MTIQEFKERVYLWAEKLKVEDKLKEVHVRRMKNKLASCSSKGRLTFDPSVLEVNKEEADKIIVHELLHLRYKNHGKMFKVLLKTYLAEGL